MNIAESYIKGVIELHCEFSVDGRFGKYHLVFGAIPLGALEDFETFTLTRSLRHKAGSPHHDRPEDSMFIGVTKLVQSPEKVIPSFVWLKRAHQVKNFFREFSAATIKGVWEFGSRTCEREKGVIGGEAAQLRDRTDSLIESSPEVINNVDDMAVKSTRHLFSQLELEQLVSAVSVKISDSSVVVGLEERIHFPLKFGYVIVSPVDAEL